VKIFGENSLWHLNSGDPLKKLKNPSISFDKKMDVVNHVSGKHAKLQRLVRRVLIDTRMAKADKFYCFEKKYCSV
jgi:hypothetical protein